MKTKRRFRSLADALAFVRDELPMLRERRKFMTMLEESAAAGDNFEDYDGDTVFGH